MQPMMSEWLLPRMLARVSGPGAKDAMGGPNGATALAARDTAAETADRLELIGVIEAAADGNLVREMLALAMSRAASSTRGRLRG